MNRTAKVVTIILVALSAFILIAVGTNHMAQQNKNHLHIAVAYGSSDQQSIHSYESSFFESALRQFEEDNPQAQIVLDSIPIEEYSDWFYRSVLAGDPPDVFTILPEEFPIFMDLDMLEPISYQAFEGGVAPSVLSTWSFGTSNLYGIPYAMSPPCLIVNRNLLPSHKTTIDEYIFDWNDLYYYAITYTEDYDKDGFKDQIGVSNMDWRTLVYANGQSLFDMRNKTTYFNNPNVEYAIKFAVSMNRLALDDYSRSFIDEKALIKVSTLAEARYLMEHAPELDLEILPIPKGPDGNYLTEPYNHALGIYSGSTSKELANKFLRFIALDQKQQTNLFSNSYSFPVLESAQHTEIIRRNMYKHVTEENLSTILSESNTVPIYYIHYYDLMEAADKEIFQYIQTDTDVAKELNALNQRMEKRLQDTLD